MRFTEINLNNTVLKQFKNSNQEVYRSWWRLMSLPEESTSTTSPMSSTTGCQAQKRVISTVSEELEEPEKKDMLLPLYSTS
jgi:hypothetical protein